MSAPAVSRRAVAALFLERQFLERPRTRRLTAGSLADFVGGTCGLQIDSVNVIDRAHHLTLWSRFGEYDRDALERLVYRRRVLFEFLSHVACFVDTRDLPIWRGTMAGCEARYRERHGKWLRESAELVAAVERAVRERGPLGNADFERPGGGKGGGWWSWKPATHALDFLWKSGRIGVHSRRHFHKRFAPIEQVLPHFADVEPLPASELAETRLLRSLRAMGAASRDDLRSYWTYPQMKMPVQAATLARLLRDGRVLEVKVEGHAAPWYVRAEDRPALERAGRRRAASRGTSLLCPFDSFLWHRERIARLFGFHYRIEIYVPGHLRAHGYYTLPVLHDGQLIGRVDPKLHRERGVLEIRRATFEPWFAAGQAPPAASWGAIDRDDALAGLADALASLARFTGATRVKLGGVRPGALRAPLARALAARGVED